MSATFRAVQWNRQKKRYDLVLLAAVVGFLGLFSTVSLSRPDATVETTLIRGLGLLAYLLVHVILCIGPLTRLDRRWLPLLYNRRHLGVATTLVAMAHAAFALLQYHAGGAVSPLVSLLSTNAPGGPPVPFEYYGVLALGALTLLAVTSHDFWLELLGPRVWKRIHLLIYPAYGLLVLHVAFGALQLETGPAGAVAVAAGAALVVGLHVAARVHDRRLRVGLATGPGEPASTEPAEGSWVPVCRPDEIEPDRAHGVVVNGQRVAVFRHSGGYSAVGGVCRHQGGPLAEGRIVDGCITCPWHGYQYRPEDGTAPAPYDDKLPTYRLRLRDGMIEVNAAPLEPGTPVPPLKAAP